MVELSRNTKRDAVAVTLAGFVMAVAGCSSSPPEGAPATGGSAGMPSGGRGGLGSAGMGVAGAGKAANGGSGAGGQGTGGAGRAQSGGAPSGGAFAKGGMSGAGGSGGTPAAGGVPGGSGGASNGGAGTPGVGGAGGMLALGGAASGGAPVSGSGGSAGASGEPVFHVFLLLGQSNMAGYPKAQAADKVEDPRVRVLGFDACADTGRKENEWDTASPPLHECWNGAIGPGDYFAKTVLAALPSSDTIGLVPCAISGEKIETFQKAGGSKYSWIIQRAKLAQDAGGIIDGMIFHQGESNCGDSAWPGKVGTVVEDLRADLGLGDAPFLAGELPYGGDCATHNTQVNKLPMVIENAHVVSASGLAVDPADTQWNLHFDHDSNVELGKRYGQKMLEALGW